MSSRSPNLTPSLLMISAMALFATEDVLVKSLSGRYSVGHIMLVIGTLACVAMWAKLRVAKERLFDRSLLHPTLALRNLGEIIGTFGFVSAITSTELSLTTALFQANPLAVVLCAAIFLGEPLRARKVFSVLLGLAGVMLILRPGTQAFDPKSLFALQAIAGLTLRDVATRKIPSSIPSARITAFAFFIVAASGLAWIALTGTPLWVKPNTIELTYWCAAASAAVVGYTCLVAATRMGQLSVVVCFRYSRLIFAMIFGVLIFDEEPDAWTLIGSLLIVLGGALAFLKNPSRSRQGS